jgi:hypothetical protein
MARKISGDGDTQNQSTEGAEFVWVSECEKGECCEIMHKFILYGATNAFQRFNCSKLAIRLIATLIFDSMFIWLKQFVK